MFGLGAPELVIIMGIAFLVFGGKKLPELGAGMGKAIKSFKNEMSEPEKAIKEVAAELQDTDKTASAKE
ncbi:MAG: twin-arginine translocase TatA/TatE family subunit [Desulfobulbaceae bacterium]|nr:twin-arginine translocase TatA/TatE family subunit [Desulfobulbaceae bacterium]